MQMPTLRIAVLIACDSNFGPAQKPADNPTRQGHAPLQYHRTIDMVFHMKTTLNIDDTVMAQLKREAARQKRTMSELVETALRGLFRSQRKRLDVPPLPTFHSGGTLVDIADRDALHQAMEGR
jgi:hypothetical protein